ncbi:YidC/Oxa1 family membrane protein insertase [Streptomyces caniscabiei]|uniref:YidC/Oxa1 family membrane protein insertase n=1 Tax=Streptomyces caniscabiei TaxID=2746961 RepID=UPI0029B22948|nr:YidC/Oxa1 family membrane protein insertase [Streptomyces caniscabiei]MDX2776399.1 YidC/Oxa1 family membrane protein insertase [Streptomyces caniscabiei]
MNIFDILIVQPIFNLLIGLYSIIPGGDFGVSLIIFTILVRFALYPLVKRQLHQTKMMRKLQPELARIKKRAKGNKQLESMQMLELYKKHGVSPFRSIGILLIQLPIFIALFHVIQIFTQHRDQVEKFTYGFMENIGPIRQLIEHPDQFNEKLFGIVDLTKSAFTNNGVDIFLILLAVVAAWTQYVMSKQTMPQAENKKRLRDIMNDAAQGKEADQAEMNAAVMGKMIKVLPFFMFFIMVTVPGALALYYAVSNIVAVAQQSYLLKKDEDELEEIAEEPAKPAKKATAKAREKAATTATVTRIKATDSGKKKGKK